MASNGRTEAWNVTPDEFSPDASPADKMKYFVRYAALAPSTHNTQPWRFRIGDGTVELIADRTRALPVVDPADRELVMSCGAALLNLRVAIRAHGYSDHVATFPEQGDPSLLARVTLGGAHEPSELESRLLHAIVRRRTNRLQFRRGAIDAEVVAALEQAAAAEGAWLVELEGMDKRRGAELVAAADRVQWSDPSFRNELAQWIVPNTSSRAEGVPGYAMGFGTWTSRALPFAIRRLDLGRVLAARDRALARRAEVLAVLGTRGDEPVDWLCAGQAMERVALTAHSYGFATSHLDQAVEIATYRDKLRKLAGNGGYPQQLIGVGRARELAPTPRRSLSDVIVEEPRA